MHIDSPFNIGALQLPHRLIQGPLAGFSCAPFRQLYSQFVPPAYSVSEMISAHDVLHKHAVNSRYLYRGPKEKRLCYQLAGHDPDIVAQAALRLEGMGADLIDLNCGCPKTKIRKKGAGSALLDDPARLVAIVTAVRKVLSIPFTVKIRIYNDERDIPLAKAIEQAGADALIVHGRRWTDDYSTACQRAVIAAINQALNIPVIANGDITDRASLMQMMTETGCAAYMISRAGCGNPCLYQQLLTTSLKPLELPPLERIHCFLMHLHDLAQLESEYQAILQSKTLVRYYFRAWFDASHLRAYYALDSLQRIEAYLYSHAVNAPEALID